MKTVVSLQELADLEIHPGGLLQQFWALAQPGVSALAAGPLVEVPCPGCGAAASPAAFEKWGLTYRLCAVCATVYVSPRPAEAALTGYAQSSPASAFWRDRVAGETRAARLDKLIRPRAEWVSEAITEHRPDAAAAVDVSPHDPSFPEELSALSSSLRRVTTAAPARLVAAAPASLDVVTAFDVIDRAADVRALTAAVHAALRPGGLFLLTAPSMSGFDLQVLWDRSTTIVPPDKLNLLSVDGFSRLFAAPAWEVIELSTPGMFDVENVRRAMLAEPDAQWPRGVRDLVMQPSESARLELQEYLQRHRLSSFARLVVRRR